MNDNIINLNRLYLNIGGDKAVRTDRIIGIFDMDNSTTEKSTVEFLETCEKNGITQNLAADIPVSFVLCENKVFLSPFSPRTLRDTVRGTRKR